MKGAQVYFKRSVANTSSTSRKHAYGTVIHVPYLAVIRLSVRSMTSMIHLLMSTLATSLALQQ